MKRNVAQGWSLAAHDVIKTSLTQRSHMVDMRHGASIALDSMW